MHELSIVSIENLILKKSVGRDLLNPILIYMNPFIENPLVGIMNFNSCVFKTKIRF